MRLIGEPGVARHLDEWAPLVNPLPGQVQTVAAKEHFSFKFRLKEALHEWRGLVYAETLARDC